MVVVLFSEKQLATLKTDLKSSRRHAFARNTNRNLNVQWETFLLFCFYFCLTYLPVSTNTLSLFAQFLSRSFRSIQSIKNYISGVKTLHYLLGYPTSQINEFVINLSLRGINRLHQHLVKKAQAITPSILLQFYEHMDMESATDTVFWCLFLFAFFLFARKSNLVPDTPNYKDKKFLLRQNVKQIDKILIVSINWSKTIQFGQRILEIPLVRIPGSVFCPVRAYQNMCKKVKASRVDPLFSLPKGKCIIYAEYQKKIRELVREIGLDPESFSSHSFRGGGSSYAFRSNVPTELIKSHGDWRSDCYQQYLSFSLDDKLLVAKKMRNSILSS